jgi:hypothetical protein
MQEEDRDTSADLEVRCGSRCDLDKYQDQSDDDLDRGESVEERLIGYCKKSTLTFKNKNRSEAIDVSILHKMLRCNVFYDGGRSNHSPMPDI